MYMMIIKVTQAIIIVRGRYELEWRLEDDERDVFI
jgi:hypothetical protein